jgi:hypothetical protein
LDRAGQIPLQADSKGRWKWSDEVTTDDHDSVKKVHIGKAGHGSSKTVKGRTSLVEETEDPF